MKRTSKKVISLLLALVCMLSCFSTGTAFARDGAITDHQAIVLVLDTSGSMSGSPITNLKKAALEFCNKIIGADPNNQIAIVTFATSNTTSDFTNNLSELAQTISNISAGGGTYMANAIQSADEMLQKEKFENGYIKSIVIMADGDPFDPSETVQSATSLFSKYNMYSIGFFEYANEEAKNLLKSIQNCGYYEANDVNTLIDEFVKIATDILNPFTIKLSHENIGKTENTKNPGSYTYKYKITAEIINGNSKQANNVNASITLGQGMTLSSGSNQTINIGVLGANETKTLTWNIEMPMVVLGVTMYDVYSVTASSDNTVDITASDKIIIDDDDDYNKKNNELDFSKDVWSFGNFGGPLYMSNEDKGALLLNLDDKSKANINNKINLFRDETGGHCWGMSATTILSKMGIINPCIMYNGTFPLHNANCLHDIAMNPSKDSNIESLISFYQMTQFIDEVRSSMEEYYNKSNKDKISYIIEKTDKVKNGGSPVLIAFQYNVDGSSGNFGHIIVGYAYEKGLFSYENRTYDARILIYDCNYNYEKNFEDDVCLYVNTNTWDWELPKYNLNSSVEGADLAFATNDMSLLNIKDIDTSLKSYSAVIEANSKTRFILKNKNGSYSSNDIFNKKINNFRAISTFQGESSLTNIFVPNNEDYTIQNVNKKDILDYNISYDDAFLSAKATTADNVKFNYNGQVGLTNNEKDYSIASTVNNGPLQWYTINVSGEKTANPILTPSKQGFVFEGDTMDNITVTGTNDTETKELTFTTTEDKVLIGENDDELTVSIDKDKDGVYETVIADSKTSKKSAELTNLETENFELSPAFAPAVRDYNSSVDYSVSKVALTPTLENGTTATISVNNSAPVEFNGKQSVDLNVGKNTIKIVVSSENLESSTYTITVNRSQSSATKSPNNGIYETVIADSKSSKKSAELKNLETENFELSPAFAPAVRDYNSSVDYSVSKVALTPTLDNGITATISVNNSTPVDFDNKKSVDLNVGKNTIKIVVSSENLESSTYTITVNRSQSSATKSPNTGNNLCDLVIPIVTALVVSGVATVVYIVNKRKKKFY